MKVEVLGVNTIVDIETGKPMTSVSFGRVVNVTEDLYTRAKAGGTPMVEKSEKIGIAALQLYYEFDDIVPYRLHSVRELTVDGNGFVTLKEISK